MRWPRNWNPPLVIAWRLLWLIPWYAARVVFVAMTAICFGPKVAEDVWEDT